jgi:dipeptidyl aminopeptidase/acylaminoacyl peptidase
MASKKKSRRLTIDDLWKIERLGVPSLSPDGAQAVCALSRYDMEQNKGYGSLVLLSTFGGAPRRLTHCGEKDSEPQWSPRGDLIAFVAKREQEGKKDEAPQLYVIAPDGGEARRITDIATGVSGIQWFADGKRVAFISWVWPDAKGEREIAKRHKAFKERKESAYVTEEHQWRYWDHHLPMGRVAHLFVVDVASGRCSDLFAGTGLELQRDDPDANCYAISPDGRQIVYAYDPEPVKRIMNHRALARIDLRSRKHQPLLRDKDWDFGAPRFSHDAQQLAFVARHQGRRHTAPAQAAVMSPTKAGWRVIAPHWDREVASPLRWRADDAALYFTAEDEARCHLWQLRLDAGEPEVLARGGWVHGFDAAQDVLAYSADSMQNPARIYVRNADGTTRRIESFNDALLAGVALGRYESVRYAGARGTPGRLDTQMWVVYPPGFDPKRKYPLLHSIHGGPHTASGDTWHYRWNNHVFASGNDAKGRNDHVVVCVNYHGSTSFGFDFKDSITHRWGELELQDVEAATDLMLAKPYIDRKRVYATGGSYGGYMVAWMNGHCKPGRYQAYVCHAGCFDWVSMFASDGAEWFKTELGAWYWDDMQKIHAQSPHAHARNFSTPTLVMHGQLDYRVPDAQGLAYYNTLKAQNIDARLVWFPDENHWILKPRNSRLWYREFFDWLGRYPAPPRAARKAGKAGKAGKTRA